MPWKFRLWMPSRRLSKPGQASLITTFAVCRTTLNPALGALTLREQLSLTCFHLEPVDLK